ncbi:MAG TPA: NFACT family protein [Bacteroidota bacterium]|nr:NFACT family protein [Bacteroidota bacterium]
MITNYFTLRALCKELVVLRRSVIREVYSQFKNQLFITARREAEDAGFTICISVDPKFGYCFMRSELRRAKKNSVDLVADAVGCSIDDVSVLPFERILKFDLSNNSSLLVKLFDTAENNVLLINEHRVITESFKHNKSLDGKLFEESKRFQPRDLADESACMQSLVESSQKNALLALKHYLPSLGTILAREILCRASIDEELRPNQITASGAKKIFEELRSVTEGTYQLAPKIYQDQKGKRVFSFMDLRHLKDWESESFASVNEGVRAFVQSAQPEKSGMSKEEQLKSQLGLQVQQLKRSLEKMNREIGQGDRSGEYEHIGKLLTANIHRMQKGLREIVLQDPAQDGGDVTIALESHLPPAQNAARYYEKAKNSRVAYEELRRRKERAVHELSKTETLLEKLSGSAAGADIKELMKKDETLVKLSREQSGDLPPFRIFQIVGGYEVWVGKNSANNDELTLRYAKPHDLWFHARGVGGSHTVLKTDRSVKPPKEAISQAASIAAYYSKMRSASNVPVAYCERKYIRKPKGAPPGTVILERETVIFVQPRLPQNYPIQ